MALGTADEAESVEAFAAFLSTLNRPRSRTIADLWAAYCRDNEGKRVLEGMRSEWKVLAPRFGHLTPDQIRVEHSREHIRERRGEGRKDGTTWTELGHLRTVLNWAVKRGYVERAPYIELPMKPPPKDRRLTRPEARRLMEAASMPHVRLYILVLLGTACRSEAALELTWDQVDMERGQIDLRMWTGQRRKGRAVVPMNTHLRAALSEAHRSATTLWVVEYAGRRVTSVRTGFSRAVKRAGLGADVTPTSSATPRPFGWRKAV